VGKCVVGHDSTLVVVKPHAVKEGLAGLLLDTLADAFTLTAAVQTQLDAPAAAEFLEVYKGVVPPGEFSGMVAELTSGPCIAVEVRRVRGKGGAVRGYIQGPAPACCNPRMPRGS
jgi:nucleoside-diphosphate kinase